MFAINFTFNSFVNFYNQNNFNFRLVKKQVCYDCAKLLSELA